MDKKSKIKIIVWAVVSALFLVLGILCVVLKDKLNKGQVQTFVVISFGLVVVGVGSIIKIIIDSKKGNGTLSGKEDNLKEQVANKAFDTFLKEGTDYTVAARVDGAILVKKTVRWAYFNIDGGMKDFVLWKDIHTIFSIETDKGLYCFQLEDGNLMNIKPEIVVSMYPVLSPSEDTKKTNLTENEEKKEQ